MLESIGQTGVMNSGIGRGKDFREIDMRRLKITMVVMSLFLLLLGGPASPGDSTRVNISTTVPPLPCRYPNNCAPINSNHMTGVRIENGVVYYTGS